MTDVGINCVWDITRDYLVFKTNGQSIDKDKRYLVLNLRNNQHRIAALVYAENTPNMELAHDLQCRIRAHEKLDAYLANFRHAARHSDDLFWTSHAKVPLLPVLAEEKCDGLYAKYQICDRSANPAEGDFFVLSVDENSVEVKAALAVLTNSAECPTLHEISADGINACL
jgi:hypothetical protein